MWEAIAAICAVLTILGGFAGGLWWIGFNVGSTKTLVLTKLEGMDGTLTDHGIRLRRIEENAGEQRQDLKRLQDELKSRRGGGPSFL